MESGAGAVATAMDFSKYSPACSYQRFQLVNHSVIISIKYHGCTTSCANKAKMYGGGGQYILLLLFWGMNAQHVAQHYTPSPMTLKTPLLLAFNYHQKNGKIL
jgi:hypothetical protein